MPVAILAVVAWTWTIATLFFTESPQPIQAATLSVSRPDTLQIFLVADSERVMLTNDSRLKVGKNSVGYLDMVAPLPLEVEVHNATSQWLEMQVTGDVSHGVVPVFGDGAELWLDGTVNLAPKGEPGSGLVGLLDFQFRESGPHRQLGALEFTTRQNTSLPTSLGFEDDSLGELCSFIDADPIRDEFLESHGVSFQAGHTDDGMAVLHECGNFGLDSRSEGDYLLVGNERGELANEGIPELPLTATFTQNVTQVSLWAAAGVRAGPDTLTLGLTAYADAGGTGDAVAAASLDATMEWQQLSVQAPDGKTIKSVKLTNESDVHSYLVDDMAWTWAPAMAVKPPSCLGVSTMSSP